MTKPAYWDDAKRELARRDPVFEGDAARDIAQWGNGGGFSVHAAVRIEAADQPGRERLLRYCAPAHRSPWNGCKNAMSST